MNTKRLFYVREPGHFYAFSLRARNEREARDKARAFLGRRTLRGCEFWSAGK